VDVLDPEDVEEKDSTLCFSNSIALVETNVEVCDRVGVSGLMRGAESNAESETCSRSCRPLNSLFVSIFDTTVFFRVGHFLAFLPFSRFLRGPSPRAPASTTVR
jgi:hypothetical protein